MVRLVIAHNLWLILLLGGVLAACSPQKKKEEQRQPEPIADLPKKNDQTALESKEGIKPTPPSSSPKAEVKTRKNQQVYAMYQQKVAGFKFEAFPVKEKYHGPAAPLDLVSHGDARLYRKTLTRRLATGSNFAGKYTLVNIDCGPTCLEVFIIETRTGKVVDKLSGKSGVSFRPDSRLLVLNPPDSKIDYETCEKCEPIVYVMENELLYKAKLIR